MAYFAQFDLDVPAVAMVTASHNDNGWTGVKMGCDAPLTFGPDEMGALRDIVLSGRWREREGGRLIHRPEVREHYLADLKKRAGRLSRPLKVVCACGNGTAGAFAPEVLRAMGAEVIELHCRLDHSFPHYNPNPEDMKMLHDMAARVRDGLFDTDPVLRELGARTDYYKTGHSYIKRRTTELEAIAGFEKSGHFFFRPPVGLGYDDGIVSAIAVLHMLDHNPGKSMADLYRELPRTWGTPTMAPHCPDEEKYEVIEKVTAHYRDRMESGGTVAGLRIMSVNTVNGCRFTLEDGTWGLIRASSNKPELVVVAESPASEENMRAVVDDIRNHLAGPGARTDKDTRPC